MLIDEAADDLAVIENERHVVAAHFENRPRAGAARLDMAETGIEEAGVMHAEFAHHGSNGTISRVERRHMHSFAADENIELVGIKDQFVAAATIDWVPEVIDVMGGLHIHIESRAE